MARRVVATYSIAACDPDASQWGVAVQSKFLAVGSVVPWAEPAVGDRRGQQSASLLVVQRDAGYAQLSDTLVDLRVDDHERPIEELRRIYAIHDRLFGVTPRQDWLPLEGELAVEVRERLARL